MTNVHVDMPERSVPPMQPSDGDLAWVALLLVCVSTTALVVGFIFVPVPTVGCLALCVSAFAAVARGGTHGERRSGQDRRKSPRSRQDRRSAPHRGSSVGIT
jgi:hypothetical protein